MKDPMSMALWLYIAAGIAALYAILQWPFVQRLFGIHHPEHLVPDGAAAKAEANPHIEANPRTEVNPHIEIHNNWGTQPRPRSAALGAVYCDDPEKVERYDYGTASDGYGPYAVMFPAEDGGYVAASDYDKLLALYTAKAEQR